MAHNLSDYVKVYDDTLSPEQCRALIDRFESEPQSHERTPADKAFRFVELNASHHWPQVEREVTAVMMDCFRRYWEAMQVGVFWPKTVDMERLRLKRYLPGGEDKFPPHVDVMTAQESRRFMTAILYLNEPGGGETVFPGLGLTVTPAPGACWSFRRSGFLPMPACRRASGPSTFCTGICGIREAEPIDSSSTGIQPGIRGDIP